MLSELRKYRLSLVLAHQYLTQLEPSIKDAVLGNVGTIIVFRIGATDAESFAQEFAPEFKISDFTNLPNYRIYLKLMIDGKISAAFSAETLPPDSLPSDSSTSDTSLPNSSQSDSSLPDSIKPDSASDSLPSRDSA